MGCAIAALVSAYMSFRNATGRVESCALLRRALAIGLPALVFLSIGPSAEADMILNGSFESTTLMTSGPFVTSGTGTAVDSSVADWTVDCAATANHACSTGDPYLTLVFPGEGTIDDGYNGNALYGPMSATSPDGGNFVAADGDPSYSAPFSQTINGLTPGQSYLLTFYQAAGQQVGLSGATTEYFQVTLGTETINSTVMDNPSEGFTAWNQQDLIFVAASPSEVLTFLSVGTPSGAPPIGLLDGVSLAQTAPEPSGIALLGSGVLGIIALRRRRRKRTGSFLGPR